MLPGGVNSPVRAMGSIGRDPIFIERGERPDVWDVDGNRYVDWVCSWGPLILGHAHPAVVEAVTKAAASGTSFGAPTEGEVELAERVVERFDSVEMIRMVNSGTEAAMSAIRLARAATGRERILKFAGAYHGHLDGLLVEAGSGMATAGVPASPGVPESQAANTVVVPWNDPAALERAIGEHSFAAILAEPIPANMGVVPPGDGFLAFLREAADSNGALLVLDEVISGFRVAARRRPGAARGERRPDDHGQGARRRASSGGLRRSPRADGAGGAGGRRLPGGHALRKPDRGRRRAGDPRPARSRRLRAARRRSPRSSARGCAEAAAERAVQVASVPGLLTVFFSAEPVTDFAGASACDTEAYGRFCRALLDRGVYPPPSQFEAWFPSLGA